MATKNRHGCLTAYLIFMIVVNALAAASYLLAGSAIADTLGEGNAWAMPVLGALTLVNVACAVALFKWKKWGFWGFCGTSVLSLGINMALGLGIASAFGGLIGVLIVFGVLHIGKDNKGWPQLD